MGEWRTVAVTDWGNHPGGRGEASEPLMNVRGMGPAPLHAYARATNDDYTLHLKLRVIEKTGEWNAVAMWLENDSGPAPFTGKLLRTIPIARLCTEAVPLLHKHFGFGDLFGGGQFSFVPDVPSEVIEQWPNGDKDLVFRWVKTIYDAALAVGAPPTKTVGEKFKVSYSRAIHLVRRSRDAGFLQSSSANDPTKRRKKDHGTSADGNRGSRED